MSPAFERLATEHLMSPIVPIKRGAAEVLGKYGSAAAEKRLWETMEYFRSWWKDREDDLRNSVGQEGIFLERALRRDCGTSAVWSKTAGPAQHVAAHASKQKAVSGDPTGGFQHCQGAVDEVGRGRGLGQRGQRGAQRFGLRAEAANPELAALVGHRRRYGCGGALQCLPTEQTGDEEQRDHRQTAAQVGQEELGQQGDGALADLA